jgi:hypothetical protein
LRPSRTRFVSFAIEGAEVAGLVAGVVAAGVVAAGVVAAEMDASRPVAALAASTAILIASSMYSLAVDPETPQGRLKGKSKTTLDADAQTRLHRLIRLNGLRLLTDHSRLVISESEMMVSS